MAKARHGVSRMKHSRIALASMLMIAFFLFQISRWPMQQHFYPTDEIAPRGWSIHANVRHHYFLGYRDVPRLGLWNAFPHIKRELEKSYYNKATVIIAIDVIPKVSSSGSSMGPGGVVRGQEYFTVFGQVLRQGKYELPFDEDVSISQAILRAGGPAQFANLAKVRLIRKTPQGNKTVLIDVDQIMTRGSLEYDVILRSNDVLIIPEKVASF
jgi:hypothetical protein